MMKYINIVFLFSLVFTSCIPEETAKITPVTEQEKRINFSFFTDKDYSSSYYNTYAVKLNVGISLIEKGSGEEVKILEETTGWISFKDIPKDPQMISFQKSFNIDTQEYSILYGYSHQVKIGETLQLKAKSEYLKNWENLKEVIIKF